jgi:hypothetical protein
LKTLRYVVEDDGGVLHIANERQLRRMKAMRRDGAAYRAIGAVTGHGPKSVQRILERVKRSAP